MAREEKDIWLDKGVFRQQVRLAAAQVASLSEAELEFALAYEVEPFSGIGAGEAEIAWREIEEEDANIKAFEVAVIGRKAKSRAGKTRNGSNALIATILLGAIALALTAFDYMRLDGKSSALESKVEEQTKLDSRIRAVASRAAALETERLLLREERARIEGAGRKVARLRSSYSIVMDVLASVCGGKTLVKTFSSPEPFAVELKAVAVNAQSAADVMASLASEARSKGWRLEPGEITAKPKSSTAEFCCRLYLEEAEND